MSTLITASLNLSKIDKARIVTGKTGNKYIDVAIWINDQPDQYGNDVSIQQRTNQGEEKIYLGNGRIFKREPDPAPPQPDQPAPTTEYDDLPF